MAGPSRRIICMKAGGIICTGTANWKAERRYLATLGLLLLPVFNCSATFFLSRTDKRYDLRHLETVRAGRDKVLWPVAGNTVARQPDRHHALCFHTKAHKEQKIQNYADCPRRH